MDDEYRRAMIERVKPRFHGKETIRSRASWNRPDAAERDYKRLMRQQNTQKPHKKSNAPQNDEPCRFAGRFLICVRSSEETREELDNRGECAVERLPRAGERRNRSGYAARHTENTQYHVQCCHFRSPFFLHYGS